MTIAEAVERVYAVFAGERLPTCIDCAPTEDRRLAVDVIVGEPLRQLGPQQLDRFATCAMTTIGNASTYRHFLPRIIELAADGAFEFGLEPWMIAGKLRYGHWREWTVDQQEALADLFDAAARLSLELPMMDGCRIEAWLVAIARLDLPLNHLLARWRAARSSGAVLQLASFASDWAGDRREALPPYWKDVPEQSRGPVRDWLLSRDTMMQLADALGRVREDDRWVLSGAIDRIRFRLS